MEECHQAVWSCKLCPSDKSDQCRLVVFGQDSTPNAVSCPNQIGSCVLRTAYINIYTIRTQEVRQTEQKPQFTFITRLPGNKCKQDEELIGKAHMPK